MHERNIILSVVTATTPFAPEDERVNIQTINERFTRVSYQWTTDDDEVALHAIIVGIGSDEKAFSAAGIEYGEVLASIYWPDWIAQGDKIKAALEGPFTVPEALQRADELCALWAYNRVVIAIQDRDLWRAEWGDLREHEGLD